LYGVIDVGPLQLFSFWGERFNVALFIHDASFDWLIFHSLLLSGSPLCIVSVFFLSFFLSPDLNRVQSKPYVEAVEADPSKSDAEMAELFLAQHKLRNDSFIHDLFLAQFKSTLVRPQRHCEWP